jgi:hypothetical protein
MADRLEQHTANRRLAKAAVQCSADTFVVNQTLVFRIKFCGKNRQLLVAAHRFSLHVPLRQPVTAIAFIASVPRLKKLNDRIHYFRLPLQAC